MAEQQLPHVYEDERVPAIEGAEPEGRVARRSAWSPGPARPIGGASGWQLSASNAVEASDDFILALPQPDWLFHTLTVTGPAEVLAEFRAAARGPGVIPWSDERLIAEDWVDRLVCETPGPGARAARRGARAR